MPLAFNEIATILLRAADFDFLAFFIFSGRPSNSIIDTGAASPNRISFGNYANISPGSVLKTFPQVAE